MKYITSTQVVLDKKDITAALSQFVHKTTNRDFANPPSIISSTDRAEIYAVGELTIGKPKRKIGPWQDRVC